MNIWNMAWKNISRNRRRSILSGIAICIAAFIICLLLSVENGMLKDIKTNVINHVTGSVRIRNTLYTENERIMPLQFYIPETEAIIKELQKLPFVEAAVPQTKFGASIYRDGINYNATVMGVDFKNSRFFNGTNTAYISGSAPQQGTKEAVISEGLAKKLALAPADKFTIFTKTATGGTNGITLTVSGIVHIGDTDFNGNVFFMDWQLAASFLRMNGNALELLIFTDAKIQPAAAAAIIGKTIENGYAGIEALPWMNVNILYQMYIMFDFVYIIIGLIFFLLASTVIFNTTMMAVLERKKEIGMLLSLGMNGTSIVLLFLLESFLIAVCSAAIGIFIGWIGVSIFSYAGLDLNALGGNSISGMNFSSFIYPELDAARYALVFVIGVVTALAACIGPARMALRVQPAEALRG